MELIFENLAIRDATLQDAPLLCKWWNDGAVMAHAGFPNGLGTTVQAIEEQIAKSTRTKRLMILEIDNRPAGELCYEGVENCTAKIGIKICEVSNQEKGYGKKLLSMLIRQLFSMGYEKIVLDTNLENTRAQHVYEALGLRKMGVRHDCWKNQLGQLQSVVDYALVPGDFCDFAKTKNH